MPSVFSLFRHNRDKARPSHASDEGQWNKVTRRRSRFSILDSGGPSRGTRETASFDSAPAPLRSVRASTTDVPELPSVPIYQNFVSAKHLSYATQKWHYDGSRRERRLSRVATISDFHSLRPHPKLVLRERAAAPTTDKPAENDRATELARIYQSILPDFRAMCEEEGGNEAGVDTRRKPENGYRDTIMNHGYGGEGKKGGRSHDFIQTYPKSPPPPPTSERRHWSPPSTIATVKSYEFPNGASQRNHRIESGTFPRNENGKPPNIRTTPSPEPSLPRTTTPEPDHDGQNGHDSQSMHSQQSTIGLQICAKLLVDQLRRALDLQTRHEGDAGWRTGNGQSESEKSSDTKQLEMLLLIEAYESVLWRCRKEAAIRTGPEPAQVGEGEASGDLAGGMGSNHVAEAVPILEHWLETLHLVYEETFEEHGQA
ncbi:hypothetical protein C7999DRAFT_10906 [Corynascus novoguineensis]|uniref:Uncharacterized protein n=1 Tax=Corynascus novoguineensis TaxID=1126955 RepID=A0AAN7D0B8_9PEZI|nr:hypothetical protein C7999DRAFT_10906 [Corynascus novoguineensis]